MSTLKNNQDPDVVQVIRRYLKDDHRNKKKTEFDMSEWVDYTPGTTVHINSPIIIGVTAGTDIPQQVGGFDCGVFACRFAETLSRSDGPFDFSQVLMIVYIQLPCVLPTLTHLRKISLYFVNYSCLMFYITP